MGFQGVNLAALGLSGAGVGLGEALPSLGSQAAPSQPSSGGFGAYLDDIVKQAMGAFDPAKVATSTGTQQSANSDWVENGVAILLGIVFVGIGLLLFKPVQDVAVEGARGVAEGVAAG
jgi:hypothetical protein